MKEEHNCSEEEDRGQHVWTKMERGGLARSIGKE